MEPRTHATPHEVPTHCQYSRCDKGPDGGPAPVVQHPHGKRTKFFCCDTHRAAADQLAKRLGRVAMLPAAATRHVTYGEDVVAVHRDFRSSIEALRALAEQLATALVAAGDIKAAKAAVDEGEKRLDTRERQMLDKLAAMTEARFSALDRAEAAEEAAESERLRAEQAHAMQLEAEALLAEAREEIEHERAALLEQSKQVERAAEQAVSEANVRAAAAQAAQEQAEANARAEIARVQAAAEMATREARELAARADGAREASLAEVKLAHEDARRSRDEIERMRRQLEQQLERERGVAQTRVEEVRAGLQAQLSAAHQLCEERALAREQLSQQLSAALERAERAEADRAQARAELQASERSARQKKEPK